MLSIANVLSVRRTVKTIQQAKGETVTNSKVRDGRGAEQIQQTTIGGYRTSCGSEKPSTAVVLAIAKITDTEPLSLPQLAKTIDPDALDTIIENGGGDVQVTFTYASCDITVTNDRQIRIISNNE